jgi:hypothetical protein
MASNPASSYHLVPTAEQLKQLRTWGERATRLGRRAEYLAALRTIHHKLTTEPTTWGDPWYHLIQLGLQVYQRICSPLHVSYAVDEERRIVYVRRFTPLSGSDLEQEGEEN